MCKHCSSPSGQEIIIVSYHLTCNSQSKIIRGKAVDHKLTLSACAVFQGGINFSQHMMNSLTICECVC